MTCKKNLWYKQKKKSLNIKTKTLYPKPFASNPY